MDKIVDKIKDGLKLAGTLALVYGTVNGLYNFPKDSLNEYNRPSAMFRTEKSMKKALDYQNELFNDIYNQIKEQIK